MVSGRPRWKLSFRRSGSAESNNSSASSPSCSVKSDTSPIIPLEFLCPVSNSLMADPVILPSGQTFERACIEACAGLSFCPPSLSPPVEFNSPSPVRLIPNVALKTAITNWCDRAGLPRPNPVSMESASEIVRNLMPKDQQVEEIKEQNSNLSVRTRKGNSSISSISNSNTSLSSISNSSLSSSSSLLETPKRESLKEESLEEESPSTPSTDWLEEEILFKLRDFDPSDDQDEVLVSTMISLRQATRETKQRRLSLCTPRLLSALCQILLSQDSTLLTHTTASIANLSTETENKIPIVRAGIVPPLILILKKGSGEERENAAGALFSLALEEENRAAIGCLGAISPLIHLFCRKSDGSDRIRNDAGRALYHLSLSNSNLTKIARSAGAARGILSLAISSAEKTAIRKLSMRIICNLSNCNEGRASLLDSGAISSIIGLVKTGFEEEYSVATLYGLSKGSMRFRGLAKAAGAERVLERLVENGEGVRKEMARKVLRAVNNGGDGENGVRGRMASMGIEWFEGDSGEIEEICEQSVVSEGMSSFRRRFRDVADNNNNNNNNNNNTSEF